MVLNFQRMIKRIETDEGEAHALSGLAGQAFELLGTPKAFGEWWNDKNERMIEGWFDEMRDSDLKANGLGAQIGSELWERVKNEDPIEPVIAELREGKFGDVAVEPVLASRLPRFSHGLSRR